MHSNFFPPVVEPVSHQPQ